MTGDINSQVQNVASMINDMVSLTAESGKHAKTSSVDLESLVQTARTMADLSNEVEHILDAFKAEFETVKQETGTIDSISSPICWHLMLPLKLPAQGKPEKDSPSLRNRSAS